jgi:photosystem II stability/assembly factor-like uncharacterized protein
MINRFKHIILFLVLINFQLSSYSQGSWERIEVPTQHNLNSVYFTDSITGWAVGDSGIIINTLDGGINWTIQNSTTENDIVDVFFVNEFLGWASSFNYVSQPYGTTLLKTENGGVDWIGVLYPEENIFINSILFLDSLVGWLGGSPHAIVNTTDGGNSWHQASVDTSTLAFFPVLRINFYNEQYGYASGGIFDIAGVTWHTNNGGELWYAIDVSDAPADEVHALHIFDSIQVMGAGGDPDFGYGVGIISTNDGGDNWEYEELEIQGNAVDIDFINSAEVWAPLGPLRTFIYSVDTGATWTQIPTPESTAIFDVIFPDSLHGFAVGNDGAMLKFTPETPVSNYSNIISRKDFLLTNYPNPFNSYTNITFELNKNTGANLLSEIKIYDLLGNKVSSLIPKKTDSGIFEVRFETSTFLDGIYYYQLFIDGSVVATNRMILIR